MVVVLEADIPFVMVVVHGHSISGVPHAEFFLEDGGCSVEKFVRILALEKPCFRDQKAYFMMICESFFSYILYRYIGLPEGILG